MMAALPQRAPSRIRIGRYAVLDRIGRGGMGMVYRALDEDLEREVALKVLTIEGGSDGESRQRFSVEAKAAAQLQHRNIVTIYELGEAQGHPFIAMELLEGVDLESLMRSGERLLLAEKLEIVGQVCRGLAYAHERHIVHRDVKPSNIRLLDDGVVKLVDFGIAKLVGVNLTQSGMVVGTVHYMSPEQVRGAALDGRSDVFSAGIVLQELLSGARPFEGNSATEVLYKIVHSPAPPLQLPPDSATDRLQRILDRALAKDLDQRYPSAAMMADELAGVPPLLAPAADRQTLEHAGDEIGHARRLLREGRTQEAVTRLKALERVQPDCLELRRAQRAAKRQLEQTKSVRAISDEQEFPELAATFQVRPSERATRPDSAKLSRLPVHARHGVLWLGSALVLIALLLGGLLLTFRGSPPAAMPLRLSVRSEPPGAEVLVDGVLSGTLTDGELNLDPKPRQITLTLRKPGYEDGVRVLALPRDSQQGVSLRLVPQTAALRVVSEPAGASVKVDGQPASGRTPLSLPLDRGREHRLVFGLEGHAAQEQLLTPGFKDDQLLVRLVPNGPLSTVTVSSAYPLDVSWNGKPLRRAQTSPQVTLPAGHHTLLLTAPNVFLKATVEVDVRDGAASTLTAPALGRLNVQAVPDNCQVYIDGTFADYPPILERQIVVGAHRVQFRWVDGARREELVDVAEDRASFVTGQRE